MSTIFTASLDGTDGADLTVANSGVTAKNGPWVYETTSPAEGTAYARLALTGSNGHLGIDRSPDATVGYHDFVVQVDTLDGGNLMIAQLRNGAANKAQVVVNADGTISLRNNVTTVDTSTEILEPGEWMRLQWGISGTTQTLRIFKSATLADLFNNPATEVLTGSYTAGAWIQFRLGVLTTHTLAAGFDRIVIDDTTWPTSGGVGNIAPTADAGTDQSAASGTTVTLSGAGTDPDGTIASYAWTQTAGPAVTLSSSSAQNPTFTAPVVTSTTVVTFELRVTDDDGAQSDPDTTNVTVSVPSGTPTEDFFELFEGSSPGTAISAGNTAFVDFVDTGMTFVATPLSDVGAQSCHGSVSAAAQTLTKFLTGLTSEYYVDALFRLSSLSGGPFYLLRCRSGTSTIRATVRVNADGTVQMRNGVTVAGTTSPALITAGQTFRLAWHIHNDNTTECRIYVGANLWGATPDATITMAMNSGTFDRFSVGQTLAATVADWWVDAVRADASDWPAPLGSPAYHSNLWLMGSDGAWHEMDLKLVS